MFLTPTREEKASEFMKAAGKKPYDGELDDSIVNNILEEAGEVFKAITDHVNEGTVKTRADLCKELADLQVVLSNAAWYFDVPLDAAFNRVHDNNMTKVVDGKIILRQDGKILKPANYVKPDMRGL